MRQIKNDDWNDKPHFLDIDELQFILEQGMLNEYALYASTTEIDSDRVYGYKVLNSKDFVQIVLSKSNKERYVLYLPDGKEKNLVVKTKFPDISDFQSICSKDALSKSNFLTIDELKSYSSKMQTGLAYGSVTETENDEVHGIQVSGSQKLATLFNLKKNYIATFVHKADGKETEILTSFNKLTKNINGDSLKTDIVTKVDESDAVQEAPLFNTDGGKTDYYNIDKCLDLDDLAEHWDLKYDEFNVLKAIAGIALERKLGVSRHSGTGSKRDTKKLLHYANRIANRDWKG